jgi:hypothetical protein
MSDQFEVQLTGRFEAQIERLCDTYRIEAEAMQEVLIGVRWSLTTNPHAWPRVPETRRLHVAKTNRRGVGVGAVPALRIFFRILAENRVELLHIETIDVIL